MDIDKINDVAYAWASHERNEANRGKGVRSKGWVTKEQMRKDAAQKAIGIMIVFAALTLLANIFIKIFGKAIGAVMMVVLVLGLPICFFIQENMGYNIKWLPLWIVAFALSLKIFTKIFGKKWGMLIGIPVTVVVGLVINQPEENEQRIDEAYDANPTAKTAKALKRGEPIVSTSPTVEKGMSPITRIEQPSEKTEKLVEVAPNIIQKPNVKATGVPMEEKAEYGEVTSAMIELIRRIKSATDPSLAVLRVQKIRNMFIRIMNGHDFTGKPNTAIAAYNECLKLAQASGWLQNDAQAVSESNVVKSTDAHAVNETKPSDMNADYDEYLKKASEKFNNLLMQVRTNKSPTTPNYEIDSRVEHLKNTFEQEVRCTPFNRSSLSETKSVVDSAYQKCVDHAYRMHWIKTEQELSIEKGASAYLDEAMKKIELLVSQIKLNTSEPSYVLNDRAKYIKEMFDREMRFPLRDRWNSVEEAKTHTVKAYQTCLNHALRMNWIKER